MKKILTCLSSLLLVFIAVFALASCKGNDEVKTDLLKVEFMDGESVLKTVEVKKGSKVESYTPEKEGYQFGGWFATPTLNREFNFDSKITKDTRIFSKWISGVEDTRDWYILGNFSGTSLKDNAWGANITNSKFTKTSEFNTYTLTADLYEKDEFQVAVLDLVNLDPNSGNPVWLAQMGYGLLEENEAFETAGNIYDDNKNKANIRVKESGRYEIKLITDVENINASKIVITKVGEAESLEIELKPALIGTIAGGALASDKDLFFANRQEKDNLIIYDLTISLNKGELLIVSPFNDWNVQLKAKHVDYTRSDSLNKDSKNEIEVTQTGTYKIVLEANKLVEESKEEQTKYENYDVYFEKINTTYTKAENVVYDEFNVLYEGLGEDYKIYVRNNARFPLIKEPNFAEGSVLMGWSYNDGTKDLGIAFQQKHTSNNKEYNITYTTLTNETDDIRTFAAKGADIVVNDEDLGSWNNKVELTKTGKHTYEATLKAKANGTMQIQEMYFGVEVGKQLSTSNIVNPGDFINTESLANITFKTEGTYKLVLDSFNRTITITKI